MNIGPTVKSFCALLLSASLFWAACSGTSEPEAGINESAEPPTEEATAATINFEFDTGVSVSDRELVQATIEDSRRFYARELGRDLQFDITVKVTDEDEGNLLGYSYGRTAWIFTGGADWPVGLALDTVVQKERLIAHELFHNFQWDLLYTDDAIPSRSPWWILEGSAEYASGRYLTDRYAGDWTLLVEAYEAYLGAGLPRLDSDALRSGELYGKAFVAFNRLMLKKPLIVLGDYFGATGRMDWEDAFQEVFARDPIEFVQDFEARLR